MLGMARHVSILLLVLFILLFGCSSLNAESKIIQLEVRNASLPEIDPGGNNLTTQHYKLRTKVIDLPVENTALVLIDTWQIKNDRYGDLSVLEKVAREKIAPVLKAARKAGMLVLHAPHRNINWDGINLDPPIDLRSPSSMKRESLPSSIDRARIPPGQWPPVDFIFRVGQYGQYTRNTNPGYAPYTQILGLNPSLKPVKGEREYIESNLSRIQQIFRKNNILHLIYVGGATNQCIMNRPVGIRNMAQKGYNIIILRDATIGSELADTWDSLEVTKAAVLEIEINYGFSALGSDLVELLTK